MAEILRYALGQSSLGQFIAAVSDRGLVAFEFGEARRALVDALKSRFPFANVREDATALAGLTKKLAYVADHPETESDIVLDLRGSEFEKKVWEILRRIPAGRTVTYGAIAVEIGQPGDARDATAAIAANAVAILVPCHRVIKKNGSLSGYRWGYQRKRALLAREQTAQPFALT